MRNTSEWLRLRTTMPVYKGRRAGRWRVTVFARQVQQEWIVEGTRAEALEYEARKRIELQASQLTTRTAPTFREFSTNVYAAHAATHLRASTWSKVRIYQVATLNEHSES